MSPERFIEKTIIDECIKTGVPFEIAKSYSQRALLRYEKNDFKTPSKMIQEEIKKAQKSVKAKPHNMTKKVLGSVTPNITPDFRNS